MVSGLSGLTYEEKLRELDMFSLAARRVRFDMLETFKMMNGFTAVDYNTWFTTTESQGIRVTRHSQHSLNLQRSVCRTDVRRNFFSNRVPAAWNSLPDDVKDSKSVAGFKMKYDRYIRQDPHPLS